MTPQDQRVARNKVVYLTYIILDGNGQLYEQYDMPIGYVHGANNDLFEKIEQALEGRGVGETIEVTLSPDEGFGHRDASLTFTDDIENVPPEYRQLGATVEFENDAGEGIQFRVSKIADGKLTIDANHPLAGQTVTFRVTIVAIRDATLDEIANGKPGEGAPGSQLLH